MSDQYIYISAILLAFLSGGNATPFKDNPPVKNIYIQTNMKNIQTSMEWSQQIIPMSWPVTESLGTPISWVHYPNNEKLPTVIGPTRYYDVIDFAFVAKRRGNKRKINDVIMIRR